jgi:hypothetical protein
MEVAYRTSIQVSEGMQVQVGVGVELDGRTAMIIAANMQGLVLLREG